MIVSMSSSIPLGLKLQIESLLLFCSIPGIPTHFRLLIPYQETKHTHIYIIIYLYPKNPKVHFFVAVDDSISRYGFREHFPRFPIFDGKVMGFLSILLKSS